MEQLIGHMWVLTLSSFGELSPEQKRMDDGFQSILGLLA